MTRATSGSSRRHPRGYGVNSRRRPDVASLLVASGWWGNPAVADSHVELARRGFAAALRGDLAAIGELLDRDVKWDGGEPNAPGACHDEALRFLRGSEVIRGGRFELVDVVGDGDKVVVIMRPPSDGAEPAAPVANLATFRDGRVIEIVRYHDSLAAAGV